VVGSCILIFSFRVFYSTEGNCTVVCSVVVTVDVVVSFVGD
jgi:hypothetical protein